MRHQRGDGGLQDLRQVPDLLGGQPLVREQSDDGGETRLTAWALATDHHPLTRLQKAWTTGAPVVGRAPSTTW